MFCPAGAGQGERVGAYLDRIWVPAPSLPVGPTIPTIGRRSEMLFVNGVQLTEVMSFSDLWPGTFLVDEANNAMDMYPPACTNVGTSTIEAAMRSQTLSVSAAPTWCFAAWSLITRPVA